MELLSINGGNPGNKYADIMMSIDTFAVRSATGAIVGAACACCHVYLKRKPPLSKSPLTKEIDFLTIRAHFMIRSVSRSDIGGLTTLTATYAQPSIHSLQEVIALWVQGPRLMQKL